MTVHLVKLCVGAEAVEDLVQWQSQRRAADPTVSLAHVTRMWPRREAELLNGGSLFWVFKGLILARQPVLGLSERVGEDGIRRCAIELAPEIVLTESRPRRPFQGWRYLSPQDAPPDLTKATGASDDLPHALAATLAEIGVLPAA